MKIYKQLLFALTVAILLCETSRAQVTLNFTVRFMPNDGTFAPPLEFPFVNGFDVNDAPVGPTYNLAFTLNPSFTTSGDNGTWTGTNIFSSVANTPGLPSANWVGGATQVSYGTQSLTIAIPNQNQANFSSFSNGTGLISLDLSIDNLTTFTDFISGQTLSSFFSAQQSVTHSGFTQNTLTIKTSVDGALATMLFQVESLQITSPGSAIPEPSTYASIAGSLALLATLLIKRKFGKLPSPTLH